MRESSKEVLARYQKDWDEGGPLLFGIEDVFDIAGRGPVVTGHVKRGGLKVRDEVEIVGIRATRHATAAGLEFRRKLVDEVTVGDECGVLLAGIEKSELIRGQVLASPGSVRAHQTCTLTAYLLSEKEGGRSRAIRAGEEVQFHLHGVDVAGTISAKDGAELRPGAEAEVTVHISVPMALVKGLVVPIRPSAVTIGPDRRGKVTIGFGSVLNIGS